MEKFSIKIKGKIAFTKKEYKEFSRKFTAELTKNEAAFQYGNGMMVIIKYGKMKNGRTPYDEYLDVRYAKIERSEIGLAKYIAYWFQETLGEHKLTLTFKNKKENKSND